MPVATRRNLGLDLLRGVCALTIAVYHLALWRYEIVVSSAGTFGVYIFFILSSLTMTLVYSKRIESSLDVTQVGEFYWNRLTRIVPLLALVSFIAIAETGPELSALARALLSGSGLFSMGLPGQISLSVGTWSLAIELVFYALFPVIAIFLPTTRTRRLVAIAAILVIAQQLSVRLNPGEGPFAWAAYTMPITFAPFFAFGLVIHRISVKPSPFFLGTALLSALVIFGYSLLLPLNYMRGGAGYLLLSGLCALTVFAAYNAALPKWLNQGATFMGEISYSLYLTHWIAYKAIEAVDGSVDLGWAFGIAFVIAAGFLAYLVYWGFERPVRDFLRQPTRRAKRPALTDAPD